MKRALLLVLILANLGVFAWVHWYVLPGRTQPAPSAAPGGQPLKLMSELTPAERKTMSSANPSQPLLTMPAQATAVAVAAATHPTSAATTAPAASTVSALVCASFGPFPNADAVSQAVTRLKTAGITTSQRELPGKSKRGYWVYLPPFRSRAEADAAAALLKQKGVADIYVVPDEANRNAVSLGVFNQKEGAVQREREIKKLGFRALMAERFRDEPRYWLDARGPESALPAAEAFKDLSDEANPIGKASTACTP